MNCKMTDCDFFDCNLGFGGSCSILVGSCGYPFSVGSIYNFEFKSSKTHIPLDGQYIFLGNLGNDRISLKHFASKIEFHLPRIYIQSVIPISSKILIKGGLHE